MTALGAFLFGPDGGDVDGCFRKVDGRKLAFAQQRGGGQACVFEEQDLYGLGLGRDDPYFGNAEAFVILELFGAFGARVGRGENFDDKFRGGVNVAVALDDVAPDEYRNIWNPSAQWILVNHLPECANADLNGPAINACFEQVSEVLDSICVDNFIRRHLSDLAIDDLFHSLHLWKREPFFIAKSFRSCRHGSPFP